MSCVTQTQLRRGGFVQAPRHKGLILQVPYAPPGSILFCTRSLLR